MKPLFQNRSLHLTACILLFWKGISLFVWLLLNGLGDGFFFSTGFMTCPTFAAAAAFAEGYIGSFVTLTVICLTFLAYWVFFVLLAANRSGSGVASVGLLVLCGLDLPVTAMYSFTQWWSILVCIAFHTAIFITVVLLRRSRLGVPMQLSKTPDSI